MAEERLPAKRKTAQRVKVKPLPRRDLSKYFTNLADTRPVPCGALIFSYYA